MMKRKSIVLTILLCLFFGVSAQENDIKDQILSYKDSEFNLINKGRRLLIENLQSFKMEEAVNVKDGLLKEFGGNVSEVFYNIEYIHLLYWTREFDVLLNFLRQVDLNYPVSNNVKISAQTDDFFTAAYKNTIENKELLDIDIKNWELNNMEKDLLLLLLNDLVTPTNQQGRTEQQKIDIINQQADQFLANYPESPYETIVREQIRVVFKDADWGLYMDFGMGASFIHGNLGRQFNNGAAFDMMFEYRYRKLMGMFGFGFSGQSVKQNIEINNTVWKKDAGATLGNLYLNAGYLVFENHRWSIYPFAGVGYIGFSAADIDTKEDKNLKKLGLNSLFTQVGAGIDLKLKGSPYFGSVDDESSSRLSLRYSYRMPRFERKDPIFSGSQHTITLSWGIGGRPKKRDL